MHPKSVILLRNSWGLPDYVLCDLLVSLTLLGNENAPCMLPRQRRLLYAQALVQEMIRIP